jgi:transcriptional regulator with XRE-family HTH domain
MGSSAQNGLDTRLRAARQRRGMNREALAFQSGVSWSAIAQVETGRRTHLRPGTLQALARTLGVTIDYLVTGGAAPAPMLSHRALLYSTDAEFAARGAAFLAQAADRSEPALAVTTDGNIALLRERLGSAAAEVEFADCDGWYTTPTAGIDAQLAFVRRSLEAGAPWAWILAEPPCKASSSDVSVWTRYEAVINLAFGPEPVSILCAYDTRTAGDLVLSGVRTTHPQIIERDGPVRCDDYADPVGTLLEP